MEFVIGAIIIIILLLILGVPWILIVEIIIGLLLLLLVVMFVFFAVTLVLALMSRPVKGKFLRIMIHEVVGTYAIYEIDGKVTDKEWAAAVPCTDFRDIRGDGWAAPKYLTTMRMLWDDDNLYVSAVLEEPDVKAKVSARDDIVYHDNDFEVFLNPYSDSRLYYEFEINALGTVMDLLMEKPYSKGGTFIMTWDFPGLKTAVKVQGTLNRSNDIDKGWSVEIMIPFDGLKRGGDDPRKNKEWKANFSRVEWLTKPEENWVWSPTGIVDIHHPDKWGTIRFVD